MMMQKISLESIEKYKDESTVAASILGFMLSYEFFLQEIKREVGIDTSLEKLKKLFKKTKLDFGSIESAELLLEKVKSGEDASKKEMDESIYDMEVFLSELKNYKKDLVWWQKKRIFGWMALGPGKFFFELSILVIIFILFGVPFLSNFEIGQLLVQKTVSLSNLIWKWISIILISASLITLLSVVIIFFLERKNKKS